jgi:ATP-dependent helicase HrpA
MEQQFRQLTNAIAACMLADQRRLASQLRALRKASHARKALEEAFLRLQTDIHRSQAERRLRAEHLPVPTFPEGLPVNEREAEISEAITAHQVVIICGETGSGKTTQLPKICLSVGRGVAGLIGHTQPRRIAARSVAARIAAELGGELGKMVGYKVRFSDRTSRDVYIKLMTDGILLAETQSDRFLDAYDTLIIDEAHERSLNIDFLLGYIKQLLPRRPELKVIITSATIDPQQFSRYFSHAPIIEVSGRRFPVEVRYRPLLAEDEHECDRDLKQAILDAVDEVAGLGPGDILIFLAGEREIRDTAEALRKHHLPHTEILPLYARLSAAEQERVFQPHSKRRIVLATNVAETSLTVPGIRYVIDPGYARVSRYSHRSKVQRLLVEEISRASCDQRKGRCGRVSAGVCIRLYSEADYLSRLAFTDPEIKRANLAAVILQMKALKLGDVERFAFIDPPDARMINDGFRLLAGLAAVDARRELTPIGRQLARLPVDPCIGRMLLAAHEENALQAGSALQAGNALPACNALSEVLVIASALSIQDPRERPLDAQQAADEKHRRFLDEQSDFLAYLNLWRFFESECKHLSQNKQRTLCREHFLSLVRMREWHDIHQQLYTLVREFGFTPNQTPADYRAIHRALLAGLLGNIAFKDEAYTYTGARNIKLSLFPGSGLFKKGPKWLMAATFLETSRVYAHTVARIEPEWIEQLALHLLRRSFCEPHWERRTAQVAAYERVTLYGLVVVARRKVNYGPIDPIESRRIFIQSALVEGDYQTDAPFFQHNRRLMADIEELENKSRRRDVLVDEQDLYAFYDARIPDGIWSGARFETWRKEAEKAEPKLLYLTQAELMRHGVEEVTEEQYPDSLTMNGTRFPLTYHFELGHPADGVTLTVPLPALNQVALACCEWLVPGLLRDKIVALIRSLPKSLRRTLQVSDSFVPVPNYADVCLQSLTPGSGSLTEALAAHLHKVTGVKIPADAWQPELLPDHLRMNFKVVDGQGKVLATGRDLSALQAALGQRARTNFAELHTEQFDRQGITRWDFGDLPEQVVLERQGLHLTAYPAIEDRKDSVALKLFESAAHAAKALRGGVRRLALLELAQPINHLRKNLPDIRRMCMHFSSIGNCEALKDDLILAIAERAFLGDEPPPRTATAFEKCKEQGHMALMSEAFALCELVDMILTEYYAVAKELKVAGVLSNGGACPDIHEQLAHLLYRGFVAVTPLEWLIHIPRYLKAIRARLEKRRCAPARDAKRAAEITPLWRTYLKRAEANRAQGLHDPALERYRWMLEEFRVSLFAQALKTAIPVSEKRLKEQWERVRI